jgi:rhodanese-related sulfurtransferase
VEECTASIGFHPIVLTLLILHILALDVLEFYGNLRVKLTHDNCNQNNSFMKKLLALCAAVCLTATVYAGEFKDITIKELKSEIAAKKVTLLDANGTESWQNGHIPGALNFETTESKLTSVLPKDKSALIVAYCGNPKCTAYQAAAKAAKKLGYTNIKHLSAGIAGWKDAGEKTEKGS